MHKNIYIIADIEGSSGYWKQRGSMYSLPEIGLARLELTKDVNAMIEGFYRAGAENIIVKDFHGNGYNVVREVLDKRVKLVSGYYLKPILALGNPGKSTCFAIIGGHPASGEDGFVPHTLSSRFLKLEADGKAVSEIDLLGSVLAPFGIAPLMFVGCEKACKSVEESIPGISVYGLDKSKGKESVCVSSWRQGLALAAEHALLKGRTQVHQLRGLAFARITMEPGQAKEYAQKWGVEYEGADLIIRCRSGAELYQKLMYLAFSKPVLVNVMGLVLWFSNFFAKSQLKKSLRACSSFSRAGG